MIHELKIAPCYFAAVKSGDKTFEVRDNSDRGFQKGDMVVLREYKAGHHVLSQYCYTDRQITKVITYVTNFEQKPGYVVFAMADPAQLQPDSEV